MPKCKKSVLEDHDEKLRDRLEKSEKFGSFSKFSTENNQNLGKNGPKSVSSLDQNVAINATNSDVKLPTKVCGKNGQNLNEKVGQLADFSSVVAAKKPNFDPIDSPIRGKIKKGTVVALKDAFDRLAEKEDDAGKNLKRLSRSCLKPLRPGAGSGKKKQIGSRRINHKFNLLSNQALISDFYPRAGGEEQESGNS